MTPLKNGVNLKFPEYNAYGRADVYKLRNVYLFITTFHYEPPAFVHASVYLFGQSMRRKLINNHEIIVVEADQVSQHHEWEYVPMSRE